MSLIRYRGGFRQLQETELGLEQACRTCGQLWPADQEFYLVTANGIAYECKACTSERRKLRDAIKAGA